MFFHLKDADQCRKTWASNWRAQRGKRMREKEKERGDSGFKCSHAYGKSLSYAPLRSAFQSTFRHWVDGTSFGRSNFF